MRDAVVSGLLLLAVAVLCAGCVTTEEFTALSGRVSGIDKRVGAVERGVKDLGGLNADVDAIRAYFLEVKNRVAEMRDDTVRLLDEQRVSIDETRAVYIKALKEHQASLEGVIKELEKKLSSIDESVAQPPKAPGGSK
jgi:hypothetical protein